MLELTSGSWAGGSPAEFFGGFGTRIQVVISVPGFRIAAGACIPQNHGACDWVPSLDFGGPKFSVHIGWSSLRLMAFWKNYKIRIQASIFKTLNWCSAVGFKNTCTAGHTLKDHTAYTQSLIDSFSHTLWIFLRPNDITNIRQASPAFRGTQI